MKLLFLAVGLVVGHYNLVSFLVLCLALLLAVGHYNLVCLASEI